MSQTRVLVTGGAGFTGSRSVRTLPGPGGPDDVTVTVLHARTHAPGPAHLGPVQDSPRSRPSAGRVREALAGFRDDPGVREEATRRAVLHEPPSEAVPC
ncbi:hypothetical protein [Streptomyces sp. ALI-76-A]|jgi:nucleoside-diphosphate-sugar epimerase|uniref:hypothetical protein n=1 Tax=Streptomyces sp. ALI-76-A TaxID=3025736 RepID=UPI003364C5AB